MYLLLKVVVCRLSATRQRFGIVRLVVRVLETKFLSVEDV